MRECILILTLACSLLGCSSVPRGDAAVRDVIAHFTAGGFPAESTVSVLGLFPDERLGHAVNVNRGVFWYSRDGHFSIQFEVEGCPNSGDAPVTAVWFESSRQSRNGAARDVYRWLEIAGSPTMPTRAISDAERREWFEATWSKDGRTVHAKAWVAHGEFEWLGVLQLYPQNVVMVY